VKTESSSLTSLDLGGLGIMERFYVLVVTSLGLATFLMAMVNERRREFGARIKACLTAPPGISQPSTPLCLLTPRHPPYALSSLTRLIIASHCIDALHTSH
jgi:truncated hemoglobin YjbI